MERQKSSFLIGIALILVAVLVLVGWIYWLQKGNWLGEKPCTQEAKLCPDGSAVGRTGPNCEFAACPENKDKTVKCTQNSDCQLSYTGNSQCAPCDLSNTDYKCVSPEQAKKVQEEWRKKNILCSPCPPREIDFGCACNAGICEKAPKTDIDTSSWQTYRNTEYGFEIKYPQQSILHEQDNFGGNLFTILFENKITSPEKNEEVKNPLFNYIIAVNRGSYLDIDEWFEKEGSKAPYIKNNSRKIQFANRSAIETISGDPFFSKEIRLIDRGFLYLISASWHDIPRIGSTFDQFLSTFKFID